MAAISCNSMPDLQVKKTNHGVKVEEIDGVIRVYKDVRVERPPIVATVACSVLPEDGVTARDVVIDKFANLWARIYVPIGQHGKLPVVVYFHGGGFCVGSASWICYHEFLTTVAATSGSVILSINYRLAPENRLPAGYDDGINVLMWLKHQALNDSPDQNWWLNHCDLSSLFLMGDSAGANIAYNVAVKSPSINTPLRFKGIILIQPFFGGEVRTCSEKNMIQPPNSALCLSASDTYWRLSLPLGASRDHPYCNPLAQGTLNLRDLQLPPLMICVSEMDILKDRNLEFCSALTNAGKRVQTVVYKGVGHAFQILNKPRSYQIRTREMLSHLSSFIRQQYIN